ncbi:MAG TPA: hypothetical protein VHZ97_30990, partial [Pseudonocardiaceae bacterium]|nr:hypothetical protein [Pseudonocardiaceae bacterium]
MLFAAIPALAGPSITVTDLGILPGGQSSSAVAINDAGTIVGSADTATSNSVAVKWSPSGTITSLASLPGSTWSTANGINKA